MSAKRKELIFWGILVIIIFLIANNGYGQSIFHPNLRWNDREYSNINVSFDPYSSFKDNGANLGIEIEYVGMILGTGAYVKAAVTNFIGYEPTYSDFYGSGGISLISDYEKWRYYAGGKVGFILRDNGINPSAGFEAGIDCMINDNIGLGIFSDYVYRSDFEFQGGDNEMRFSTKIKVIFKLKDL